MMDDLRVSELTVEYQSGDYGIVRSISSTWKPEPAPSHCFWVQAAAVRRPSSHAWQAS